MPGIGMRDEKAFAIFISVLMVATGSMNTIAAKWADTIDVDGVLFDHPFFQASCMFIGELSCLAVYFAVHFYRRRAWQQRSAVGDSGAIFDLDDDLNEEPLVPKFNPFIFFPPAFCDVFATSLMYVGLNLTAASSFQMLRGAVIIFTGLLSVAFLRTRLQGFKWLGMGLVSAGLLVVGLSDILFDDNPKDDVNAIITGDLLIVMAQIITAIQMVTEQKFVIQYDVPPLLAVGLEGLFGFVTISLMMIPMYFIHVPATFSKNPEHRLEDVIYALIEIHKKPLVAVALLCTVVSIAFFNFAGVSVTKHLSATTRMVLDSVRILMIWAFSILFFGEKFIPLQLLGFGLFIFGMFVYYDIYVGPRFRNEVLPHMGSSDTCTLCCVSICDAKMRHFKPADFEFKPANFEQKTCAFYDFCQKGLLNNDFCKVSASNGFLSAEEVAAKFVVDFGLSPSLQSVIAREVEDCHEGSILILSVNATWVNVFGQALVDQVLLYIALYNNRPIVDRRDASVPGVLFHFALERDITSCRIALRRYFPATFAYSQDSVTDLINSGVQLNMQNLNLIPFARVAIVHKINTYDNDANEDTEFFKR